MRHIAFIISLLIAVTVSAEIIQKRVIDTTYELAQVRDKNMDLSPVMSWKGLIYFRKIDTTYIDICKHRIKTKNAIMVDFTVIYRTLCLPETTIVCDTIIRGGE